MRTALRIIVLMLTLCALSGCGKSADYHYEAVDPSTGKSVKARIKSNRDVQGPTEFSISPSGKVTVKTGTLSGGQVDPAVVGAIVRETGAAVKDIILAKPPAPAEPEQ